MRAILLLLFTLAASISSAEFSKDSICYVYFHKTTDTVIYIKKEHTNLNKDHWYSLHKVLQDSSGHFENFENSIGTWGLNEVADAALVRMLDSVSSFGYEKGINISDQCTQTHHISGLKKKARKQGGTEKYAVEDIRVLGNGKIIRRRIRRKYYTFNTTMSREDQIKKIFTAKTYIWTSADSKKEFNLYTSQFWEYTEKWSGREMTVLTTTCTYKRN